MTLAAETCFDLQPPVIGRAPGRVCLTPFGEILVEHQLLKTPVVLSVDRVRAAVEATESEDAGLTWLARDPVALHLPRDGVTPPNVVLVFNAPVRVGPFKLRAQQVLGLSWAQRWQGVDVDVLGLAVAEPALLLRALLAIGVSSSQEVGRALEPVIGRVPPDVMGQVEEGRRRRERRRAWQMLGFGLVMAAVVGGSAGSDVSWETSGRIALASVAAATLVGLGLSVRPTRPRSFSRLRLWGGRLAAAVAGLLALSGAIGAHDQLSGGRHLLVWSLVSAVTAGAFVAAGQRALVMTEPTTVPGDPLVQPRRRWLGRVPVALLAVVVLIGTAASEEASSGLIRDVQDALIAEEDIPGWTECCRSDEIIRGDSLDEHICGGDDDLLPAHRAAVRRSFDRTTPGHTDLSDAHLDLTVLVAPTVADAKAEFAAIDSSTYLACTSASISETATAYRSGATGLAESEWEGRSQLGGVPELVIDQFHLRVPASGNILAIEAYFVRARVGRAIVRMPMLDYVDGALDSATREAVIHAVLAKVEAADL